MSTSQTATGTEVDCTGTASGSALAPYVGPRPFERREANLFFGRDDESETLTSLIISHRIVLMHSASGLGKSSLLAAKVIPSLEQYGYFPLGPFRASDPNHVSKPIDCILQSISIRAGIDCKGHLDLPSICRRLIDVA